MSNARDVENRWHDPRTLRQAVTNDAVVIAVAGIAFAIYATTDRASLVLASSVPAILLLGCICAFVKAYQAIE
jgi:uridylate kinase